VAERKKGKRGLVDKHVKKEGKSKRGKKVKDYGMVDKRRKM
jgi:hypothetical protein